MMFFIGEWVSGKIFSCIHGNNLVYNTCWEDPRLDKEALQIGPQDDIAVITSAGCNALSYALEGPKSVHAVDMNPRQNALLELKIAGIRGLDFETFFRMFGDGHLPEIKTVYRTKLRDGLSDWSRRYWDRKIYKYFALQKSFYFCGTSGRFARGINVYIDRIGRFRADVDALLSSSDLDQQREIWRTKIRQKLWSRPIRFLVNRDAALSMLGVPRAQRRQIERTYNGQVSRFAQECLDGVFCDLSIQDNYFWRVYATGKYTKKCCPEYLTEENFNALKRGKVDSVVVHTDTMAGFLERYDGTISRFVLLDHMDWLSDKYYGALCGEWEAILAKAAPKARVIWRSGGLSTDYVDTIPVLWHGQERCLGDLLSYRRRQAADLHKLDRVHTYGSFYIADLFDGGKGA